MNSATAPRPAHAASTGRIQAIDLARGLAVVLMIVAHTTNALMPFSDFPDWGQVPVHALTKFASSLFVIVFGVALAVAFVPKVDAPDWPQRRNRLLLRGLWVLFWYKVLTVVEMYQHHAQGAIVDTLLYRDFPSFVEILGFYAIALLWIPFFLPLWARLPAVAQWASPVLMGLLSWWLLTHAHFWSIPQLQAVLVEHPDYYTWGQLARGPLVLLGLLIGGLLLRSHHAPRRRWALVAALAMAGVLSLAAFAHLAGDALVDTLREVARNIGKHPPDLPFMLYSIGGALILLALAVAGGERLARVLRPVTVIGGNALMAFVFHIVVIFVLLRDVLGYQQAVSYPHALGLAAALVLASAAFVWVLGLARRGVRRRG